LTQPERPRRVKPSSPGATTSAADRERQRQLARAKRRATGLLAAVTSVFIAVTLWGGEAAWAGYVEATALASMAGGLADWFAVSALFRRPLRLPIPHTAIVVERKEQFAATLGQFIQERFLTPEVIVERVREARLAGRLGGWLVLPGNARRVAHELAGAAVAVVDALDDEDVHRTLDEIMRDWAATQPLAPLAGRTLAFLTAGGRHDAALDGALQALDRYLGAHRDDLRRRFGGKSPWWLPGAVEDRIFLRLLDGAQSVLQEMVRDRGHDLRRRFEAWLQRFAADLQTSPELIAKGEQIKGDLLNEPVVKEWVAALWSDVKERLRAPDSDLRRRLAAAVAGAGRRLQDDAELAAKLETAVQSAAAYLVENFQGEMAAIAASTVARWDADETAHRLELLLGPDLQYVRISGVVVGAVVGLVLHALTQAF